MRMIITPTPTVAIMSPAMAGTSDRPSAVQPDKSGRPHNRPIIVRPIRGIVRFAKPATTITTPMITTTTSSKRTGGGGLICRTSKPKARRGKILLINAVNEVTRERAQSFLTEDHIERIVQTYEKFADAPGFARVVTLAEVRAKDGNLSIPLYVAPVANGGTDSNSATAGQPNLTAALNGWLESSMQVRASLGELISPLESPTKTRHKYP